MRDITTTDLSDFGFREIEMARDLLDAWVKNGLPDDFNSLGVTVMLNRNSGNVFLTNEGYQVATMNGDTLESFYSSPYEGLEGFFDELLEEYKDMYHGDQEWFHELAKGLGREDEIPVDCDEESV